MKQPRFLLAHTLALFAILSCCSPLYSDDAKDREPQPGVPQGKVTNGTFDSSEIYPGTTREYSVYVPAQYDASKPASLMVFMDGKNYAKPNGSFRVPTVFDNLIAQKAMPVTIAVFVNPGTVAATKEGASNQSNRSFEYDALGDRYSKFLLDEFLPVALKDLNVSSDPQQRAVCGISSGGICAFTVAWERPDQFSKVLSQIGSYTNIRGGWAYPGLIRQTKDAPKPIKVYLQEGKDDLSNLHGSWPLGNQDVAAALQFSGYTYKQEITEGGHSSKWGGKVFPSALRWLWDDSAESTHIEQSHEAPKWEPHSDAIVNENVPQGVVEAMPPWESKVLKNTIRDWSIYVPAQYKAGEPTAFMIFQDGLGFANTKRNWRVPVVFDNLIAKGEMPPTIAIFLNPGHDQTKTRGKNGRPSDRSLEYDSLGDRYTRFLLEEIIPEVSKKYSLTSDPSQRAIGGSSSGAICAFTAAWEHPEAFGKVYSSVGSFTNLRGGNVYPALVRKTEPKPIRVYMADTSGDVDNAFGSWAWSNQRMAAALQYMGYDVRFDWAEGYGHNSEFGGANFPEAMKWLWRTETNEPEINTKDDLRSDFTLLNLLIPGESWEPVVQDLGFADAPCTDAEGNFYYSDMRAPGVYRINVADGSQDEIAKESISGLEFGPDGRLYGCQGSQKRIIAIDVASGETEVIATDVAPNDLAITSDGHLFFTQTRDQQIIHIDLKTKKVSVADTGILRPNGIALTNDQGTLAVSEYGGHSTWTFRVNSDGSLDAKMPTMTLRQPIDPKGEFNFNQPPPYMPSARGDGMAVDKRGRYYVTSALGVQIFDPTSRMCGVLPTPDSSQPLTSCILAGKDHQYLYVTNGKTIYRRKLSVQ
ncbi:Gluconolactonase precursor [Roseimaritima multifibrata]|uniref:Gluconolactonase n=1 Tax=Roseimaritima multifibrata TaxID=1930274 RepID=A0A517MHL0_9BACT|nr:alpha/beta hydrolase-fold protein [Roseimaritima multifibrata]QDS94359.1 Gluconolactonase precursor [Roseimaritima multifibrata]